MSTSISRAAFLKGLGGLAAMGLVGGLLTQLQKPRYNYPCRMLGPSKESGHRLRRNQFTAADKVEALPAQHEKIVIVGGGMAGLSAGWWLKKQGINDFIILELENNVGGNSTCGKNEWGSYPWGAHYVPIPNDESVYVRQLLQELQILKGYDEKGQPLYDELTLCHEPQERLFKDGAFHEGLVPKRALQANENAEMARFFGLVTDLRKAIGNDGKPAFAIPLDLSSQDARYRDLDKISMKEWLTKNKFSSTPLLWYLNYCCRDDYGSTLDNVSAWAGIHYFAGRRGTAGNAEQNAVLTWPEGNGYLAKKLREKLEENIKTNTLVRQITPCGDKVRTTYITGDGRDCTIQSDQVICAIPRFVAQHVIADSDFKSGIAAKLNYAPWLVANIAVKHLPEARGVGPSWDNVSYYSPSLGYVMADHQEITTRQKPSVITYYYPLSYDQPRVARQKLYTAQVDQWARLIVQDLSKMHPDIEGQILSIDMWPWGHGMIRPDIGYIWGENRKIMKEHLSQIVFAHSDMSGISNFEEAQYHGVEAAKTVINRLGLS